MSTFSGVGLADMVDPLRRTSDGAYHRNWRRQKYLWVKKTGEARDQSCCLCHHSRRERQRPFSSREMRKMPSSLVERPGGTITKEAHQRAIPCSGVTARISYPKWMSFWVWTTFVHYSRLPSFPPIASR